MQEEYKQSKGSLAVEGANLTEVQCSVVVCVHKYVYVRVCVGDKEGERKKISACMCVIHTG